MFKCSRRPLSTQRRYPGHGSVKMLRSFNVVDCLLCFQALSQAGIRNAAVRETDQTVHPSAWRVRINLLVKLVIGFRRGRVLQGKRDVKRERVGSGGWFCADLVRTGLTPSVKELRARRITRGRMLPSVYSM